MINEMKPQYKTIRNTIRNTMYALEGALETQRKHLNSLDEKDNNRLYFENFVIALEESLDYTKKMMDMLEKDDDNGLTYFFKATYLTRKYFEDNVKHFKDVLSGDEDNSIPYGRLDGYEVALNLYNMHTINKYKQAKI